MKRLTKILCVALTLALALSLTAVFVACDQGTMTEGTAKTTYKDTEISISVKVTVNDDKVTAITITNSDKAATASTWLTKFNAESAKVINSLVGKTVEYVKGLKTSYVAEENSLEVVATGATVSSNLLVVAVQNALSK